MKYPPVAQHEMIQVFAQAKRGTLTRKAIWALLVRATRNWKVNTHEITSLCQLFDLIEDE